MMIMFEIKYGNKKKRIVIKVEMIMAFKSKRIDERKGKWKGEKGTGRRIINTIKDQR